MIDGGNALGADVRDPVVPVVFAGTALRAAYLLERKYTGFPRRSSHSPIQGLFASQESRLSNPVKV